MTDDRLEVRVDPAFKARLKAAAKADHRSLSSFVISRLEAALSSSETPEEALNRIAQSSPEELGMSRSQARMNAVQRGSASPSLERFSKAQRKGGKA